MKGRALYLRVGVLVIAGVILAVGFLLFLAGGRGGPTQLAETYTSESVTGLDVGAPVRYRGVAIGRVTEIGLVGVEYAPEPRGAATNVRDSSALQLVLVRFALQQRLLQNAPPLEQMVQDGLRARITAQGLTGVNYVELDFSPPGRYPPPEVPWTPLYPVIPSIPSTVTQVRTAAEQLVERLADVPLERIINDLAAVLSNINRQTSEGDLAITLRETAQTVGLLRRAVEDADLAGTLAEFRGVAQSLRAAVGGPELRNTLANANAASADLRRAATRLPGTVESLERTLRSTREVTTDVQAELVPILADLRATSASLRALLDDVRRSPSQAIFGAPPQPERRR